MKRYDIIVIGGGAAGLMAAAGASGEGIKVRFWKRCPVQVVK